MAGRLAVLQAAHNEAIENGDDDPESLNYDDELPSADEEDPCSPDAAVPDIFYATVYICTRHSLNINNQSKNTTFSEPTT